MLACSPRTETPGPRVTVTLDTIARDLEVPWALAFAPDGRIFVTERVGRVRVIENGRLRAEPWARLAVVDEGEAGLMGIAVAPDFAQSHEVFVVGTFAVSGKLVNRVMRLVDDNGHGVEPTVVVDDIPANALHAGDAVAFGPDGMLYVATGDARTPSNADEMGSLAGKILRYTRTGSIPADNPNAGSAVYALGFRNVQGLAWDERRHLFATEHGPSGFANELYRRDNDELNAVRPNGDYGWPTSAGRSRLTSAVDPVQVWNPGIAPSGLAVYAGTEVSAWRGSLFVGALRGEQLRRVAVEQRGDEWAVTSDESILTNLGRIRAVAMGPDGHLYITTSNRDGRGARHEGDDHVFRLRVAPSS